MKTNPNDQIKGPTFLNFGETNIDHEEHITRALRDGIKNAPGLTKRELFSALALQGILSGTSGVEALCSVHPTNWASTAVECADALIAELNKEVKE